MVRAQGGDRDAFDRLLADVVGRLYRIARLVLRDDEDAEDAVQEALVRCWRDLPTLREPARFDPWLNRLLMHAITDEARARSRRRLSASVAVLRREPSQDDHVRVLADRDEIARVFERLTVPHRAVVVLHYYVGLTIDEAAAALGIPTGTARSRLHYANLGLRAALDADARVGTVREVPA